MRGSLHDINAGDGRIFSVGYIEPENPSDLSIYGIFMVNADGSGLKTIKEGNFEELLLYDEWLYFVDIMDGALYRMKTDGSEETLIMENVYEGYGILHGSIYVHASQGDDPVTYVWKLPMEGGEPVKIDEIGTFGGSVDMAADSIYHIRREDGDQGMTRYNALTGETSSVLDTWIDDVVGEGEWIYYFWSGRRQDNTDSGIYRSLPDGQEQTMLYQGDNIFSLNIAGGKLYWSTNDEQRRLSMMDIQGGEVSFVPLAK